MHYHSTKYSTKDLQKKFKNTVKTNVLLRQKTRPKMPQKSKKNTYKESCVEKGIRKRMGVAGESRTIGRESVREHVVNARRPARCVLG
jgi:hypothetical protein